MNKYLNRLVAAFFPERCPYCNALIDAGLCACKSCSARFPETDFKTYAKGGYPCCAPFLYSGSYATAVKNLKFKKQRQFAPQLAVQVARSVTDCEYTDGIDLITFVPMFPKRQRRRGFNQSQLLAESISELTGIQCAALLQKVKDNKEQHKCAGIVERRENVKGVYAAVNKEQIKGKNILVIDDIITTGYTLGECCRILRKSGGRVIRCAAVCMKNNA